MAELIVIDNPEDAALIEEYLNDFEYIAYDCETTGVHKGAEVIGISVCAEEDKAFYFIISKWGTNQDKLVPIEGMYEACLSILRLLSSKNLICHNATFDAAMAERYFKVPIIQAIHTDTMILAHLINENRYVALKELSKTIFGEDSTKEQAEMKQSVLDNGGKLTKAQYEMYKCDPYIMGKYGAKDALLTYKLFTALLPELEEQGLWDFFYNDESMPLLKGATYQLNTVGLKVDHKYLNLLKKQLEAECAEAKHYIDTQIDGLVKTKYPGTNKKNTFNMGSNPQLSWLLFGVLNLEFSALTDAGQDVCKELGLKLPYTMTAKRDFIAICDINSGKTYKPEYVHNGKKIRKKTYSEPWKYLKVDKKVLATYAKKYEWIARLLEYNRKMKILTTYLKGIEERIEYGTIQPSFLQHGTTSGRYSSRNPNFQNLPRDDKRVKNCIIARPGHKFVGADYSQLEPRVFAYYSGDRRLLSAFTDGTDFYSTIGMEVFNKTDCTPHKEGPNAFGEKYPKERKMAKEIALATTYGASANRLGPMIGKSRDDTQDIINNYFESFPGVKDMMAEAHNLIKSKGYVENLFGRKRRLPDAMKINKLFGDRPAEEYQYNERNLLNLSVNHRIQSTGASIVNRAMIRFLDLCQQANIKATIVLQVHDEIVAECLEEDAENVALLLSEAMENTVVLPNMPLQAVPKIASNLGDLK